MKKIIRGRIINRYFVALNIYDINKIIEKRPDGKRAQFVT